MEQLDVIQLMYIDSEREDNILIVPIHNEFKLYIELTADDALIIQLLPDKDFANFEIISSRLDIIVSTCKSEEPDNFLYDVIENVSAYLHSIDLEPTIQKATSFETPTTNDLALPVFVSLKKTVVKKSIFIAHVSRISCLNELSLFVNHIHQQYPDATHHILAYCLDEKNMDYDDDGETSAGHRVLFMLKTNKLKNCAVIVSRWYGGTKLGPSRFKIITNVARELLVKEKWI